MGGLRYSMRWRYQQMLLPVGLVCLLASGTILTGCREVGVESTRTMQMCRETKSIPWNEALHLLESGTIVQAAQSHSLTVTLVDMEEKCYMTREPEIDAILRAIQGLDVELRERISVRTE